MLASPAKLTRHKLWQYGSFSDERNHRIELVLVTDA
jgi:hypothetical protein